MRNRLLLLSAAVLLSACADDPHTTAPASRSGSSRPAATGDVMPSGQGIKVPEAKPTDQVGFTQITKVSSVEQNVVAGQVTTSIATCPAGSTAIGGNYTITLFVAAASFPWIKSSGLNDQNGWTVNIWNQQPGAAGFTYYATVYCAS